MTGAFADFLQQLERLPEHRPRYRVLSAEQYSAGYIVRHGDCLERVAWPKGRVLPNGTVVVAEPLAFERRKEESGD